MLDTSGTYLQHGLGESTNLSFYPGARQGRLDEVYTGVHEDGMGLLAMKSTPQRLKTVLTSLRLGALMDWESPIDSGPVPNSETAFDVIVVGGGPGGSGAAGYMAMNGL